MVEQIKESLEELKKADVFKEFKEKNKDAYLASCMTIISGEEKSDLQLDFFQPENHKMTTFIIKDEIEMKGEDDVFQKEKKDVEELKLKNVNINLEKMLDIIEKLRKKKYPGEFPNKIIAILQSLDKKTIWNITHLTSTLKILNIKIDAKTGDIISDKIENVFSMKAS